MDFLRMVQTRRGRHLCRRCRDMTLETLNSGYLLHPGFESLLNSSVSCPMCSLVKHCLNTVIKQFIQRGGSEIANTVSLQQHEVPGKLWIRAMGLKLGELHFYAHSDASIKTVQLPVAFPDMEHTILPLLKGMLEDCTCSRGRCRMSDTSPMTLSPLLPKRVLDVGHLVGNELTSSVRLHESGPDERSCYITLSHRWGKAIRCATKRANLRKYRQGIDCTKLPKTFSDAIFVTRTLGFKYLWIDALCIVQDDHNDWANQAPLMGAIFQNSVCTIAAHSAEHCDYGFLSAVHGTEMVEVGSETSTTALNRIYLGLTRSFEGVIGRSYIMQRGWVQQELILSRRLMHFHCGLAFWECPHTTEPEPLGFTAESHLARDWYTNRKRRLQGDAEMSWMEFVSYYSACELTYESDRLVAIDGIARTWMDRLGNTITECYKYGHFLQTASSLLWETLYEIKRKRKGVPSWSWASIKGPVKFMRSRSLGSNYHKLSIFPERDASVLLSKGVSSRGKPQLEIRAQTRRLAIQDVDQSDGTTLVWWDFWDGDPPRAIILENPAGAVCFDHPPKKKKAKAGQITRSYGEFHCVRIATFEPLEDHNRGHHSFCGVLFLKPKRIDSSIFIRVGVGIISSIWFDTDPELKTLYIE